VFSRIGILAARLSPTLDIAALAFVTMAYRLWSAAGVADVRVENLNKGGHCSTQLTDAQPATGEMLLAGSATSETWAGRVVCAENFVRLIQRRNHVTCRDNDRAAHLPGETAGVAIQAEANDQLLKSSVDPGSAWGSTRLRARLAAENAALRRQVAVVLSENSIRPGIRIVRPTV
jgi:hypothetical protein